MSWSNYELINWLQTKFPQAQFIKAHQRLIPLSLTVAEELSQPLQTVFPYPKGAVQIAGKDSANFLQGIVTCNLFSPAKFQRSLITSTDGRIAFDCWIEQLNEQTFLIYSEPGEEQSLADFLSFYHITEELEISISEPIYLYYLFDQDQTRLKTIAADYHQPKTNLAVLKPSAEVTSSLAQAANFIGIEEFENLRPQFNFARAGIDFDKRSLPAEAGLEHLVSFTKGCFIGQEPISRMHYKGRPTKVIKRFLSQQPLVAGSEIISHNRPVGKLSSCSNYKTNQGYYSLGTIKAISLQPTDITFSVNDQQLLLN